jgi:hypothetical protein
MRDLGEFTCCDCKKEFPKGAWNQIRCIPCGIAHDQERKRITKSKRPVPSRVKFVSFIRGLTIGQEQDCRCFLERMVCKRDFDYRLKKYQYPYGLIVEIEGKRFIIKGKGLEER